MSDQPEARRDGDVTVEASAALTRLNNLTPEEARGELLKCCGSTRWAEGVTAARPFRDARELSETADRVWHESDADDWLEAFRSHPKIGERRAAHEVAAQSSRWSEEEQSEARPSAETTTALAAANREYEERFGFIFIICATGKTSDEMLAALRARLGNERDAELRVAAEEQRRITHLRLRKLLNV
ncbi:MAG: 2-oxo-4-hydroxy-4-carboxy-5-ureidoimidazoline decarboxylase [Pyrinomonadaceae bacterium]